MHELHACMDISLLGQNLIVSPTSPSGSYSKGDMCWWGTIIVNEDLSLYIPTITSHHSPYSPLGFKYDRDTYFFLKKWLASSSIIMSSLFEPFLSVMEKQNLHDIPPGSYTKSWTWRYAEVVLHICIAAKHVLNVQQIAHSCFRASCVIL